MSKDTNTSHFDLKSILKAANVAYWEWRVQENHLTFDHEWFNQINILDKDETKLESWMKALHPDDLALVESKIKDHLSGKTDYYEVTMRLISKTGKYKYVLAKGKISERDESGAAIKFSGVHVDVTEMMELKQKIEEQQIQIIESSRLAAIGNMAAGIAHEINTPLMVIGGHAELLSKELGPNSSVDKIKNNVGKISAITNSLREIGGFSKELMERKKFISSELALKIQEIYRHEFKRWNISFCFNGEITLHGEINDFFHMIMCLTQNAIESFDVKQSEKIITINNYEENNYKIIEVCNNGPLISNEIEKNMWKSFYSSKNKPENPGLGLNLTQALLKKYKGTIEYMIKDSLVCFKIKLPKEL